MPVAPLPVANDPPELVFQWERRTHAHWRLLTIIGASLLVHAASFYILQVSYTPTGSELPPPAQVFMVPTDGPTGESAARWLAMTDPSLMVQPAPPSPWDTLAGTGFHYVPSYEAARPGFKPLDPLPEESAVANPPRPRPPGPVPMSAVAATPQPKTAPGASRSSSRVSLSTGLVARLADSLPPITYTAPVGGKKLLESTSFLVGIPPQGGAPFLFLHSSPDSPAAEDYARAYLARLNFRPTGSPGEEIHWGWAEFTWGSDIYR